ncbi:pentatricopeptide repeat-containing protein DOT4, chloroplastic [Cryptomeria japonica]|uniref:pentatricopeptide repeat-containing protein DOT4, chloroplastic n=1 Tax=Cryptomeria japonica TaxID=3369 RepID=UPI0025AC74DC|nr:pentatricopeptide repeat-containing protein DOT4, chloroplastic [Cryptomeria japonica]
MYVKCGSLADARQVFDDMKERDCFSWNTIIAAYRRNGYANQALILFQQMQRTATQPDQFTFASILEACADTKALYQGIGVHQSIMERGLLSDVVVGRYAQNGALDEALFLFEEMPRRNVVSWNAMIAGYAQNGSLDRALKLFKEMPQRNVVSWTAIVAGYAQSGFVEEALETFKQMQLIQMASEVFDKMLQRDVVSWNAMTAGYAQNRFFEEALETFKQMQSVGVKPNSTTFASILPVCAKIGALEQGMDIHKNIIESGSLSEVIVVNALIDMYAKCGITQKARELFDKMYQRDLVSWNAMTAGYAQNGLCKDALGLFELMKSSRTYPDHVSFTCVLFACSHSGLVNEGCKYFNCMSNTYFIIPTIDHYVCMVDLFGRAGYLNETLNFIIKMPIKPVVVVWMSLLGACRSHKNIELGVFTATLLFELDSTNTATYVLLSNIYAEVARWGEVHKVRKSMKDREIKKIPGCSWIEVNKTTKVEKQKQLHQKLAIRSSQTRKQHTNRETGPETKHRKK